MSYIIDKHGLCRHRNGRLMANREITPFLLESYDVTRRRWHSKGLWEGALNTWAGVIIGLALAIAGLSAQLPKYLKAIVEATVGV